MHCKLQGHISGFYFFSFLFFMVLEVLFLLWMVGGGGAVLLSWEAKDNLISHQTEIVMFLLFFVIFGLSCWMWMVLHII